MEGDEVTGPQVPYVNLIQVGLAQVQVEHLVDLPCLTQPPTKSQCVFLTPICIASRSHSSLVKDNLHY